MLSSSTVSVSADDEELLNQIEQIVNERDSGFGFPPDLTPLEKELVILWDQNVAAQSRAHQQRVSTMFEAMMAMAKG